ncbi:MAG TPA: hypothetical protein DDX75_09360, partial [Phycisphaerales bacterium]|nr:hypothetical protein [Phycisphaerales bacterium]
MYGQTAKTYIITAICVHTKKIHNKFFSTNAYKISIWIIKSFYNTFFIERAKMKKLIFIQLVFLFLSTILFADSNDIWLLNLENGFAPHSDVYDSNIGEISILGDVDIVYDTNSDSNTVKVGEGGNNCYLRYSNLKSDILAACGTVSIDFKIPNNLNDITGPVTFFHASHIDTVNSRVDANDSWWIGLTDKDTVRIFSRSIITDPNETYPDILDTFGDKIYDADVSLSPGWHTMEFKWTEVTKRDMAYYPVDQNLPYTPAIRETADIVMYIDEVECVNEPNTYWTPGNASVLNIGSFCPDITDQNHSLYEAGENNILLDNVRVLQPEYTDIILQQAPFTINNTSDYFYAYVPAGQTQGYLSVEIRTKTRIPEPLFDYEYCVLYYVNNSLINTANRVQNIEDCRDLILPTGEALPWVTKDQYWATAYSPNFDTNEAMINATLINFPVELKKDPYRMVFNVGDILVPGERNKFKIVGSNAFEREIRNFKLLVNYNDGITVPIDPNIRDIADTTNPIVPTTDFNVPYSARLDSTGGGIDVSVSGESYCIDSKYSYPSSAFRTLSATSAAQNWTTITIAVDGNSLNANTANYTLHRQLVKYGDHIDVLDTITNISGGTIGIRLGHEIKENNNSLTSTYMSGMKLPYKNNTYKLMSNAYKSWWNPSIYVCKSSSGIGLLARDKVFRNHIEFLMEDNAYGIHDRHFAIEAGKSYTHKWAIYPTSRSYYYDFVNAARRTLNANYLIDGVPLIASSLYTGNMNSVSDSDIDELYTYNAGKYAILFTTYGIDSDGNRIREHDDNGHRIFGPALFDPCMGDWCRYYTENTVIPRIKNVKPNVKFYPYFFLSPSSEPNAINIYPDDLVLTDSNTPYYLYKIEPGINTGTPCFIPTLTNDFGYACREYFSWALDIADGIYLDASSGLNEIVRSPNISSWDGYTCDVHLGSGDFNETDATYQFIRAMTNPALASLDYRMHYMKTAKLQGTQFWNNAPPFTEEETALQNLHFIETYNNNVARGQFTTPCGFANQFWIRDDADNGRCTWYKIIYGGLRIPYVILYKNGGLAGTILKDMYPIKPLELHPGYVLGENKIITVLSGEYGFGDGFGTDANNLVVRVYDSNGYRKYPDPGYTVRYDASAGSTVANVNINESAKEFAIVFRYNPNLPSFPIPTNEAVNISTVTDLRWCPSEDANNQKIYFDTNEVLVNLKDAAVYLGQTVPYSTSIMDLNRPLEPNTTYYWGVQTLDHNNQQINYTVWNFKTAPSTWSIDFENGFTASSGTINILGGDVNNADGHKNVYTLYDSSSDSMCARVGYDSNDNCHLNYASLDPNILGPSGTVTINFKTDGTQFTTNSVLFTSNTGQNARPVWDLTLRKWNKI